MKLLIDIPEDKAEFVRQVLANFSFSIEVKEFDPNADLNEELKEPKVKKEKTASESPTEFLNRL